jgi:putative DNA primase/helicase
MQQIWAEYLEKYRAGERWHLDSHTKALLSDTNAAHRVVDPIRERIITMFDWASVDWAELAHGENRRAHPNLQWMTATDICIRIGLDRPSKADATRAGSVTSELNRATFRKSNGAKLLAVPGLRLGGL